MSVPNYGLFQKNYTLAYFAFFENHRLVCPKLQAFSELFVSSRYQYAFSIGQEGHTSQHSNV